MTSILSSFYYLRVLKFLLFENFKFNILNNLKLRNSSVISTIIKSDTTSFLYKLMVLKLYSVLIIIVLFLLFFPAFSNIFINLVELMSVSCVNPQSLLEYLILKKINFIL